MFNKVLTNIKLTFKSRGKLETNFNENEKCLLFQKIKIKKFCNDKIIRILVNDKLKTKDLYGEINVIKISKDCTTVFIVNKAAPKVEIKLTILFKTNKLNYKS